MLPDGVVYRALPDLLGDTDWTRRGARRSGADLKACIHAVAGQTTRTMRRLAAIVLSSVASVAMSFADPARGRGRRRRHRFRQPACTESSGSKRQRQLRVIAQDVCQRRSPRAMGILDDILASGDAETQARVERLRWRTSRAHAVMGVTVQHSP